ncbi:MAG: exodeoxyribonuclease V subunit alpha [Gemmatimonadaceae bacterium]
MKQLDILAERGLLAPIDAKFGGFLVRQLPSAFAQNERDAIGIAGALLSAERARGHSCIDLAAHAGTNPWGTHVDGVALPDLNTCRSIFERSALCGNGTKPSALVLDGTQLYLYRYHAAEQRLARAVRTRVDTNIAQGSPSVATVTLFRKLFPRETEGSTDWQAVAAASALLNRLSIITGGPGTGKTTTAARILALLLQQDPSLRIALAAPTGKAAARLAESITNGAATLAIDDATRSALPREARTLHRLLGYRPWDECFASNVENPLADDVIVVDEASMVDLLMMDSLFAALRPSARIILLGDPDQLASVDTGYVLGDLCRAAGAGGEMHGTPLAALYAELADESIPSSPDATPFRDAVVRLERSYRFEAHPGIGALADAVRAGDAGDVISVLDDGAHGDVSRRERIESIDVLLAPILTSLDAYLGARTPEEALRVLGEFRVLCAVREGTHGVAGLNRAIEWWLQQRGLQTRARWYNRRPVLITANDSANVLFNGDMGVTFTTDDGRTLVYFPDGAGGVRDVAPARLPEHETAWAMTVHKSQGSEFAHVVLVLPTDDAPVLTRELLYTAVTRARESVRIVGSASVIEATVRRSTTRASGLAARVESGLA